MTMIKTSKQYKDYLVAELNKLAPGNDTMEELNATLHFQGNIEHLGFCGLTYMDTVWRVMEARSADSYPPSAIDTTNLDYYKKTHQGWFDGKTALSYGTQIFSQLDGVADELIRNPLSRRAVIQMDGQSCLLSIQFIYREIPMNEVHVPILCTIANFRSSDAIMGLPCDLFIIQKIKGAVEAALVENGLPVLETPITINVGSLHIYDKDRHYLP